ncbi:MAG: DUF2779 domain-containing protein [Gammaproteobacteria bacterium]
MSDHHLSKSRMLSGWQCAKRLWLETRHPEYADVSRDTLRAFAKGHRVGEVARTLFPGGMLIGGDRTTAARAVEETRQALQSRGPLTLFEGAFVHQGVMVRTDVLLRDSLGDLRLVEVKASTGVKPYHYIDCAVQTWVLAGLGLHPTRIELAHINNAFVYHNNSDNGDDDHDRGDSRGNGSYSGLLVFQDITDKVAPMLEQVPRWVEEFEDVLAGELPPLDIGPQCKNPYPCPFLAHCTPQQADYPVTSLPGGGKTVWQLRAAGIEDIRDIPAGSLSSETQEWVRRVTIAGKPELKPAAAAELGALGWPRFYFDFETVDFAVPIWPGTRPYQALPFQWSCHVQYADGELEHREFLADGDAAPMRACTESLILALESEGPVFVYTGFEQRVLTDLAALFPDLADDLNGIIQRLYDLHPLTRANYYHPDMKGSWSIKAVLPTLATELDYGALGEIQEGTAASEAFLEMMRADTGENRRRTLRDNLLAYCKLDTLALVELVRALS